MSVDLDCISSYQSHLPVGKPDSAAAICDELPDGPGQM